MECGDNVAVVNNHLFEHIGGIVVDDVFVVQAIGVVVPFATGGLDLVSFDYLQVRLNLDGREQVLVGVHDLVCGLPPRLNPGRCLLRRIRRELVQVFQSLGHRGWRVGGRVGVEDQRIARAGLAAEFVSERVPLLLQRPR
ncbi:hypothetical protein GCM10009765_03710 [Fodinicola feengrottensis]|uniref:Uncharacterized protein n=1 Tax=Fodinicola feengrottensis TaxID=435914 RepID=A0ABN2FSN8_9ACTN